VFDKELAFFIANQDALFREHGGKTLIIRGEKVEGAYETLLEAYLTAKREFQVGTFMLQPCEPGPSAYTVSID